MSNNKDFRVKNGLIVGEGATVNGNTDIDGQLTVHSISASGSIDSGDITSSGNVEANTLTSTITTGTAPLTISSTTVVTNLNADRLDGYEAEDFSISNHVHEALDITDFDTAVANTPAVSANTLKETNVTTDISITHNTSNIIVVSSDGTDGTVNAATSSLAGVMTSTDKSKLDTISPSADITADNETSHADVLVDGDFTSAGFMKTDGAGNYSIDNSTYSISTHDHTSSDITDFSSAVSTYETSHADVLVDGDFGTAGFMKTDGSGNYSIDNSTYSVSGHNHTSSDITDFSSAVSTYETSHTDVVVDGDFTSAGFMKTDGSGNYSIDSSDYISVVVTPTTGNFPQLNASGELVNSIYDETSFDAAGTASSAVSAHVGLTDPHIQYQKESEKSQANGYASLDGSGKVPTSELPSSMVGGVVYQGAWNASTNTPTLTSSTGTQGYYYVVSADGTTDLNGITDWKVGDWAIFNGTTWEKVDNTDSVTSVNTYTGAVSLDYTDVGAAPTSHTHDDRYYTETEIDTKLTDGTVTKFTATSNDTFTGTYPLIRYTSNTPYTSSWLTVNGSTDTLNAPNIYSTGTINAVTDLQLNGTTVSVEGHTHSYSNVSVANQSDNRLITATGTTDTLNGEANLTFDGSLLSITGDIYSSNSITLGNDKEEWGRTYTAGVNNPLELLDKSGNSLDDGGVYIFTGHVPITSTDTGARAVFWNQNGTWYVHHTARPAEISNHVNFYVDGTSGLPYVSTWHTTNYDIRVYCERIIVDEGSTGQDNIPCLVGSDGVISMMDDTIYYRSNGTSTLYELWHEGNYDPTAYLTNGADNRVVTATGTTGLNGEANLTFNGTTLNVTGSIGVTNIVTNNLVKYNGSILDDSIISDNGSTATVTGTLNATVDVQVNGTSVSLDGHNHTPSEGGTLLTSADDLDTIDSVGEEGWYRWTSSVPANAPTSYCIMFAGYDGGQMIQTVYGTSTGGKIYIRRNTSGIWDAWARQYNSVSDSFIDTITSTDEAIVRFTGTSGQVQNSLITIDDSGNLDLNDGNILDANQINFTDGLHLYDNGDTSYLNFKYNSTAGGGIRLLDGNDALRGMLYSSVTGSTIGLLDSGGSWAIKHANDEGTYFYTDGATEEFKVGRDTVTGDYGTVQTTTTKGGWGGYSINGTDVFMSTGATCGLFNDVENEWMIQCTHNGKVSLFYDGATKFETTGTGVSVTGTLSATGYVSCTTLILSNLEATSSTVEGQLVYDQNDASAPASLGDYNSTDPIGLYINDGTDVRRIWTTDNFNGTNVSHWESSYTHSTSSHVSVNNQADNRLITATGTTDTLNGEANLTYNGTALTNTGNQYLCTNLNNRTKYGVWDGTTYGMGMGGSYTYGRLTSFAITFQTHSSDGFGFWWGTSSMSNAQGAMALSNDGLLTVAKGARIGFGIDDTTSPTDGEVQINGLLTATQKSFTIDHPTKEGKKLRHGSLEGPENGVYVRGRLKDSDTIELPEYWTKLVDPDSITVQLTPCSGYQYLFVKDISDNKVTVKNESGDIDCFYFIQAERIDVDKLEVEF